MKVFISWSGNKSHHVALVFRDWLPSVIQSIKPYVSSEDIDKGARWSTDIATELENSTFGILCVTKDNINAPWLSFEAGALSKTMDKSFVSPFLFDIKRSEVDGPILQFQSTIFQKEDIHKLLKSLNKACGEASIPEAMLNKAFEVWYPTLEEELNKIKGIQDETEVTDSPKDLSPAYSEILEEILDLSRNNQKLLRTTDPKLYESLEQLKLLAQEQIERTERNSELELKRTARRFQPMFLEELIHVSNRGRKNPFGFLIILSQLKRDFPWIYDSGKELLAILKSRSNKDTKVEAIENFQEMIDFTFQHPLMRDMLGKKDYWGYMKEFPYVLRKYVDELGLIFLEH